MPFKISALLLKEVSLVDDPANPGASVVLWKKKGGNPVAHGEGKGDNTVDPEKLQKQVETQETQISDLTKRAEAAEGQVESVQKSLDDIVAAAKELGIEIDVEKGEVTKAAEPEYVEVDGVKVEKASVPAAVLSVIEKQMKDIDALQKKHEMVDLAKRAEAELPNFAGSAEQRGTLLKSVDGIEDEEVRKSVTASLKAADAALEFFAKESGSNDAPDESDPNVKLDKMAREYATEKSVSYAQAYDAVLKTKDGQKLYEETRTH